jgi:hypothetical protein
LTTTDHYVVTSGLVGDDVIIGEPIPEDGKGKRLISAADLDRAWRSSDFPDAGFAITRPDSSNGWQSASRGTSSSSVREQRLPEEACPQ